MIFPARRRASANRPTHRHRAGPPTPSPRPTWQRGIRILWPNRPHRKVCSPLLRREERALAGVRHGVRVVVSSSARRVGTSRRRRRTRLLIPTPLRARRGPAGRRSRPCRTTPAALTHRIPTPPTARRATPTRTPLIPTPPMQRRPRRPPRHPRPQFLAPISPGAAA